MAGGNHTEHCGKFYWAASLGLMRDGSATLGAPRGARGARRRDEPSPDAAPCTLRPSAEWHGGVLVLTETHFFLIVISGKAITDAKGFRRLNI